MYLKGSLFNKGVPSWFRRLGKGSEEHFDLNDSLFKIIEFFLLTFIIIILANFQNLSYKAFTFHFYWIFLSFQTIIPKIKLLLHLKNMKSNDLQGKNTVNKSRSMSILIKEKISIALGKTTENR